MTKLKQKKQTTKQTKFCSLPKVNGSWSVETAISAIETQLFLFGHF